MVFARLSIFHIFCESNTWSHLSTAVIRFSKFRQWYERCGLWKVIHPFCVLGRWMVPWEFLMLEMDHCTRFLRFWYRTRTHTVLLLIIAYSCSKNHLGTWKWRRWGTRYGIVGFGSATYHDCWHWWSSSGFWPITALRNDFCRLVICWPWKIHVVDERWDLLLWLLLLWMVNEWFTENFNLLFSGQTLNNYRPRICFWCRSSIISHLFADDLLPNV